MSVLNRKNNYFNKVRKSLIKLANIIDPESEVIEEGSFYDDVSESLERIADNYEGGGGGDVEVFHVFVDFDTKTSDKTIPEVQQAFADGKLVYLDTNFVFVPVSALLTGTTFNNDAVVSASGMIQVGSAALNFGFNLQSESDFKWFLNIEYLNYYPVDFLVDNSLYPIVTGTTGKEEGPIYVKAYSTIGDNTDGTMTQAAITTAIQNAIQGLPDVSVEGM